MSHCIFLSPFNQNTNRDTHLKVGLAVNAMAVLQSLPLRATVLLFFLSSLMNATYVKAGNSGGIYVVNYENNSIGQYRSDGSTASTNLISGLGGPDGVALMGSTLFVANYESGTIGEYTTSGTNINATLISGLSNPSAIAIAGSDIFVANFNAGTIGEYTVSGATVNASLISGLSNPAGIVIMGSDLFVVDYGSGTVGEYTTSGAVVNALLISGLNGPDGIAVMGNSLFIPNYGSGTVGEYTTSGAVVNASLISGLSGPDGVAITGNNLFVPNFNAGTVGEYTTSGVTVNASLISGLSSPDGIAISSGSVADVPPTVVITPASLSLAPGASATFTAVADGTAPLAYQWLFSGTNLPGANSPSLTISNVQVADAGGYQVLVTNAYGSATSSPATLAIATFISILQPPASAQVTAGSTATFTVQAASALPPTYQWFFGNTAISGATSPSYSVVNAQNVNAGTYTVQIADSQGTTASASAALWVVAPTKQNVTTRSYSVNIVAGTNLIANQLNQGGDTLYEIMPTVPDGTVISKYNNASGTWSSATYSAASGSWDPPRIALHPGEGALLISPTNFSLTFSGTPNVPGLPPAIPSGQAWLVSRQTDDIGTYETIMGADPQPGAVIYKWDPTNVTYDVFTYSNSGWSGGVEPAAAVGESIWIAPDGGSPVPIPEGPVITQQPTNAIAAMGGSAAFAVVATGATPLSYQWQLNNNQIQDATNSVLNISNVQPGDIGDYSVAVVNPIGVVNSAVARLTIPGIGTLPAAPDFTDAGTLGASINGTGTTNNVGASIEPGEPSPGIPIGSTVWVKWQPQVSGIASLNTAGSDFDTVLGVFTGTTLTNLQLVAADEGSGPYLTSALSFDAVAGTTYYIQISGFFGAQGNIVLSWNLQATSAQVPVIVVQPESETQTNDGPVALTVVATNISPGVLYQWMLNGATVPGATNSTYYIPAIDPSQVGLYTVGITNPGSQFGVVSAPANVVIFNPGSGQVGFYGNFHPQDKFLTAATVTQHGPNIPNDPAAAGGVDGTTIFSTVGSTADAGEPDHCGYPPCHSVWYPFTNGVNGVVTMTTSNKFDAILEVYSGPLVITNFNQLVPLACSAGHGTNGESVTFNVYSGSTYWVVVDGVNCSSGPITIFWNISAPPAFSVLPLGQSLKSGGSVTLTSGTVGTPPFTYQWEFDGVVLNGATNSSLVITNFQAANQGEYSVTTWNKSGTNTSAPAVLYLNSPPRFVSFGVINGTISGEFAGVANTNYIFESSSNLFKWTPMTTNASPIGLFNFYDTYSATNPPHYYRAVAH